MSSLVQIHQLRNFAKCPNFAKYSWNVPTKTTKNVIRSVVESCYRDVAVLNRRVDWKTIRNRVHHKLVELEPTLSSDEFYSGAVSILESLRVWYLVHFRDGTEEAICNLKLEEEINQVQVTAQVDTVLIGEKITLVEFTELETVEEILRDIGLRTKILLLGKQNIKVNKVLAIRCFERSVKVIHLSVDNPDSWNYKTLQSLQLMLFSVKNKIFYPSPTSMCTTCKYRDICSW